MADAIKSALFIDYDSLHRSLKGAKRDTAAARLAERSAAFVAAIESGKLVSPPLADQQRRRALIRRCYADPRLLGADRAAFVAGGFEVIDCPTQDRRDRNSADIHMVLDAIDALDHPTGYEEFVLLTADSDLSPVLLKLRAHDRSTVIFATARTGAAYKALADGIVEEAALVALLTGEMAATAEPAAAGDGRPRATSAPGSDRAEIEALARKVHQATNVPLFSPRTFADLFRVLAQEIAERGYHFQNTAENVTEKLTTAGRNVNRRQVLFVVKGLALKGHVFSTTDSPERLAEVFREQVLYLVRNAGLELDDREQMVLPTWIVGRVTAAQAAEPEPERVADETTAKPRKRIAKPLMPPKEAIAGDLPAREAPPPAAREAPPAAREIPPPAAREAEPPPPPAPSAVGRPTPGSRPAEPAAARLAAIAKPPQSTPKPAVTPPNRPSPLARPAAQAKAPPPKGAGARQAAGAARLTGSAPPAEANKEALESSILAAIAQAVDVLVEDSGTGAAKKPEPKAEAVAAAAASAKPEPPPEPEPSEGEETGDIGDEIQRIIASYSRARQQNGPQ